MSAHTDITPQATFAETPFTRKKRTQELIAKCFFGGMAALMVIPLIYIIVHVVAQGWQSLSWDFLTTNPRLGGAKGGIWSVIVGTLYIVTFSLCVSAPIGVLAAVYLNEYAKESWFTRIVNLAVVNLAGVPSIVHGLFGLGAFVYAAGMGKSILAASLTLAIMTMPVIIASTKEALAAVPRQFREACWNVGATRWQTIWRIVLPNSISGILTGVILQVSRTAGETAPILFTGAVFYRRIEEGNLFAYNITDQCMALSTHLFAVKTQVTNAPEALSFAIALVLLALVVFVNLSAILFRSWLRSRKKW